MSRPAIAILVLTAIAFQAVMGGIRGDGVAICFGGGHEHGQEEVTVQCDLACEHDARFPAPVPIDDHDDGCDCTDIELALVDLLTTGRDVIDGVQLWTSSPDATPVPDVHSTCVSPRGPPCLSFDDPGGRSRLVLVRSTRLIL